MYGDVFGMERQDLVERIGEAFEGVSRKSNDQIGVDARNARFTRNGKCLEEIVGGVRTADLAKDVVTKRLWIDANSSNAIFLCNGKLLCGDGIGSSRFEGVFLERGNIDLLCNDGKQKAQLICREDRG